MWGAAWELHPVVKSRRAHNHTTDAARRGTHKRASESRALTSRLRRHRHRQHCGSRCPQLHTGERATESCGARRGSFIPSWSHDAPTTTPPMPRGILTSEHRNHVLSPHGCDAAATGSTAAAAARSCTRVSRQRSRAGGGVRASSGVESRRPHDHATGAEPRGTPKRASGSRALTSRLRCRRHRQHCGGHRPHLHTGEWAMESCVGRRESFIRRGVTTPPRPRHRCRASRYSQASIGITCSHRTTAMPPPPAALRRPPPAAAHG